MSVSPEMHRWAMNLLREKFTAWRIPPVELPANSVIEEVLREIMEKRESEFKSLRLTRDEADWLVDLLEACDITTTGTWRHSIASELRETFGMVTFEETQRRIAEEIKKAFE